MTVLKSEPKCAGVRRVLNSLRVYLLLPHGKNNRTGCLKSILKVFFPSNLKSPPHTFGLNKVMGFHFYQKQQSFHHLCCFQTKWIFSVRFAMTNCPQAFEQIRALSVCA